MVRAPTRAVGATMFNEGDIGVTPPLGARRTAACVLPAPKAAIADPRALRPPQACGTRSA